MLNSIQPQILHRKARLQLQDIRHNLRMIQHISQELDSLSIGMSRIEHKVSMDKSQKLKFDIRKKLKSMGFNLDQMISVLDYKITVICKQLTKLQKMDENCIGKDVQNKQSHKWQQQHKYKINQFEQRIFEFQKRQNQYVKQISELKEKNAKLRQDFSNLSFDSNQRIKQLSEKLHNNTSPNLTINRMNSNKIQQDTYRAGFDQNSRKIAKNNFVKIVGGDHFGQQLNHLAVDYKRNKNMLDSMTSQSSEFDTKAFGHEVSQPEQNPTNLKFGCFPGKQQTSEKTKTGSSSQNRRVLTEDRSDKSRRFQFLLNNLTDNRKAKEQPTPGYQPSNSMAAYQYKPLNRQYPGQQCKSVFDQNAVKRYQI